MKGRKPRPIERQIAEGDPRKHGKRTLERRLANQPKATGELPPCPRHLKGRARAAWTFWSAELAAMKLSKRPDAQMLEGACRAYERAVKADLIVDDEGLIIEEKTFNRRKDAKGVETVSVTIRKKTHAAVAISNKSWVIVRSFCSEFGLSPISRIRLAVDKNPPQDDDAQIMQLLSRTRTTNAEPTGLQ